MNGLSELFVYMQTKSASNDVHAEKVNENPVGKVADWQLRHSVPKLNTT